MAKELGADCVLKVTTTATAEDLAKQVAEKLGVMPDISIECSGAESSIKLAILVRSAFSK
jgi:L-iditol 2-dehydrogenase